MRRLKSHGNVYRLGTSQDSDAALRGYLTHEDEDGTYVSVTVEWGPGVSTRYGLGLSARRWPGGAPVGSVYKAFVAGEQGGSYRQAWNELRRQVRDATGIDIGQLRVERDPETLRGEQGH